VRRIFMTKLDKFNLCGEECGIIGANKWNKKIEKSVRIRPIRVIPVPSPDRPPQRTQTGAAIPDTPAQPRQAFRADRRYCTAPGFNHLI